MIRGIYTAASGLSTVSKSLDVVSNNMANARTPGYKSERLTCSSFDQQMAMRMEEGNLPAELGSVSLGRKAEEVAIAFQQGSLESTGRSLDLAISGQGFFALARPDGKKGLTRNGQFHLDGEGYLAASDGSRLLGKNGPLQVGGADFTVSEIGEVVKNGAVIDSLAIFTPLDLNNLEKHGEGMYLDRNPQGEQSLAFNGKILQGSLEGSNVDMADEITKMMTASRSYQSCSQVIKMLDQVAQKSASEIGRL